MGLDSLFTVLGVLIALYTVIPRYRRISLQFRIGPLFGWSLAIISLVLIHYYQLYESLSSAGLSFDHLLYPSILNAGELAYLTIVATLVALTLKIFLPVHFPHRITIFSELTTELHRAQNYSALLRVLDRNLSFLIRARTASHLLPRIRDSIYPPFHVIIQGDHWTLDLPKPLRDALWWIGDRMPSGDKHQDAAAELVREVLLDRRFIESLVERQPYLGIRVLDSNISELKEFTNLYLTSLFKNQDSVFYYEVQESLVETAGGRRIELSDSTRLLKYLFYPIQRAINLGAWKPIGDEVLLMLDRRYRNQTDWYTFAYDAEFDAESTRSPIYVALLFFDVMVKEAMEQGADNNMWLMYYRPFTERMCRNYMIEEDSIVDETAEFPTRYDFLLYTIIGNLADWAQYPTSKLNDVAPDADHLSVEDINMQPETGVPKMAILTLGDCLRTILLAERVTWKFKKYMARIVFRLHLNLLQADGGGRYAEVLRLSLASGGRYRDDQSDEYLGVLSECWAAYDSYKYMREQRELFEREVFGGV